MGRRVGLVNDDAGDFFSGKRHRSNVWWRPCVADARKDGWRRPESRIKELHPLVVEILGEEPERGLLMTVETEIKYNGYIAQQERQITRLKETEQRQIPGSCGFRAVPGLSREIVEKLERVRPVTLGQAGRIPGVTPAAVAILDVYLSMASVS